MIAFRPMTGEQLPLLNGVSACGPTSLCSGWCGVYGSRLLTISKCWNLPHAILDSSGYRVPRDTRPPPPTPRTRRRRNSDGADNSQTPPQSVHHQHRFTAPDSVPARTPQLHPRGIAFGGDLLALPTCPDLSIDGGQDPWQRTSSVPTSSTYM